MTLSDELIWRGFVAETTISDPKSLDKRENKQFYFGADPSADSLTIGNLAAMMMCACFVRHGYKPYLLVGGATGQIGDPKETGERELKPIEEIEFNKGCIKKQITKVLGGMDGGAEGKGTAAEMKVLDNYDWFKNIKYLDFLRTIGKSFSMTQLLDRKFIQDRIGAGGSGISYAEFSYTLIQGYDFYHLYKTYGVDLQLCGADQYGNASSGISLIRKLEGGEADVWSTPLVIDPASGRKFGKSEGNAVWLAAEPAVLPSGEKSKNYTAVFDFYQFWLDQPDDSLEYLMKIYTVYDKKIIEETLKDHAKAPEERLGQKVLARGATEVVHGKAAADAVSSLSEKLFDKKATYSEKDIENAAKILPCEPLGTSLAEDLVCTGLAESKGQARTLIKSGAVSVNGIKVLDEKAVISAPAILKRGKNKFAVVK